MPVSVTYFAVVSSEKGIGEAIGLPSGSLTVAVPRSIGIISPYSSRIRSAVPVLLCAPVPPYIGSTVLITRTCSSNSSGFSSIFSDASFKACPSSVRGP